MCKEHTLLLLPTCGNEGCLLQGIPNQVTVHMNERVAARQHPDGGRASLLHVCHQLGAPARQATCSRQGGVEVGTWDKQA